MKTADKSIRILIAETYEIVRFGLTGLFKQQPDFSVIGEEIGKCQNWLMVLRFG